MQFERRTEASAQVRLLRPDTDEAAEQRGASLGGGGGGKGVNQGEHQPEPHGPGTVREMTRLRVLAGVRHAFI